MIARHLKLLLLTLLYANYTFGQAPNISYATPQLYALNTTITPLVPNNTGGAVPATNFGEVTNLATGFLYLRSVTVDPQSGDIFVTDQNANQIKRISPFGSVSIFAGSGSAGNINGVGTAASFYFPTGIVNDGAGNLYITDRANNQIKKITPNGVVTTFAGSGIKGWADGNSAAAGFSDPYEIAIDAAKNLYVADYTSYRVRKISTTGVVTSLAGNGQLASVDGPGATASFKRLYGVAADASGSVFVSDASDEKIKMITPSGYVSTYAGTGAKGSVNGPALSATFTDPEGITIDAAGRIFEVGEENQVRMITPTGGVSLVAGSLINMYGTANGIGTAAMFSNPTGITNDGHGVLYVADNRAVRKVLVTGYTIDLPLPTGLSFDSKTGIVSGVPTVAWPTTNYTVTAYNANGTSSAVVSISVGTQTSLISQTITFPAIGIKNSCDADFSIAVTSTNTGIPVTYASSNTSVATVSANGVVHIIMPGTTIITANQNGNSVYLPANPASQTLTVAATLQPSVSINANIDGALCASTLVSFTATAVNAGTNPAYQWQLNGQNLQGNNVNNTIFSTATLNNNDIITCVVIPNGPCQTTNVVSNQYLANIIPLVTASVQVTANANNVCSGESITFTANSNIQNPVYQWQVNGNNKGGNTPVITLAVNNGDLIICSLITDTQPCTAPAVSSPFTAQVNPLPSVVFNKNISINYGEKVQITPIISTGISSYSWSPAIGLSNAVIANPVASPAITTTYQLHVVSNSGCSGDGQVTVTVLYPIDIQNTFTPNNDGVNDLWDIPQLIFYPQCTVDIYNRYGMQVYHSLGYSVAWDGKFNNTPLPNGTYYYVINLKNNKPVFTGHVNVVR